MDKELEKQTRDPWIRISDAAFPAPFEHCLEFNSPAHGTWNIVHMGMLVPESHQIYVCAYNCLRGVVLTAAEMNAQERFSFVILEENDMISGKLDDITIEGAAECIRKLDRRPPVVMLFTVCVHQFLGCDLEYIFRKLGEMFPDICFVQGYMDCLFQKKGPTPEMKLRKSMYDAVPERPVTRGLVSLVGSDIPLDEETDLAKIIREAGGEFLEISRTKTIEDYRRIGASEIIVSDYPAAAMGAEALAERLRRTYLSIPMSFRYEEIEEGQRGLRKALGLPCDEKALAEAFAKEREACEAAIQAAKEQIGDTKITIDYSFHPRPLGLAKLLLEHGFQVETVYLDVILPQEESEFEWLKKHFPDLIIAATIKPECRVIERNHPEVLAVGQKAAWFAGTKHFVNVVQGGGLHGFHGIRKTMGLMTDALREEKDTEDLIIRKGWGCESCI